MINNYNNHVFKIFRRLFCPDFVNIKNLLSQKNLDQDLDPVQPLTTLRTLC